MSGRGGQGYEGNMWDYVVNLDSRSHKIHRKGAGYYASYIEWREIVIAMAHTRGIKVAMGRSNISPAALVRLVPTIEQLEEVPDDVRNWLFWWVKHIRHVKLRRRGPLQLLSHHLRMLAMINAGNYDALRGELSQFKITGASAQRRTRRYRQQIVSKVHRTGRRFK